MNDFNVVQLKSSVTLMTVTSIEGDKVNCTWFIDGKPHYGQFTNLALEKGE